MAVNLHFLKMHGLGNDFIILDSRDDAPILDQQQIRLLADRHLGIGCDQVIIMKSVADADIELDVRNADGSPAEACGNGTRCVARLIMDELGKNEITIKRVKRTLTATRASSDSNLITVDMGSAETSGANIPNLRDVDELVKGLQNRGLAVKEAVCVSVGNPHIVFFCDDADAIDVARWGAEIETLKIFPHKTNVEFVSAVDANHLRMRVWERGVGMTLACGSGACAAAVAAIRKGIAQVGNVDVDLDGGRLSMHWAEGENVFMTGPTAFVAEGDFSFHNQRR